MLLAILLVPDLVGQMLGHQRLVLGGEWGLLGEVDELEVGRVAGIGGRCGRHLLNPCIEGGVASLGHASRQSICQHEDEFKRSTSRKGEGETIMGCSLNSSCVETGSKRSLNSSCVEPVRHNLQNARAILVRFEFQGKTHLRYRTFPRRRRHRRPRQHQRRRSQRCCCLRPARRKVSARQKRSADYAQSMWISPWSHQALSPA